MLSRHCFVSMTRMPGYKSTPAWPNHMSHLHQRHIWLKRHSVPEDHLSPLLSPKSTLSRSLRSYGTAPAHSQTSHLSNPGLVRLVYLAHLHTGHSPRGHPLTSMSTTATLPSARQLDGSSGSSKERRGCGTRVDGGLYFRAARLFKACVLTRTAGSCPL